MSDVSIFLPATGSSAIEQNPSSNTMGKFLSDVLRVEKNSIEVLSKLSDIVTSTSQAVVIQVEDYDGSIRSYELPSIGFLKNEISRIDKNFKVLSGQNGNDVLVRMPDGSFKKIMEAKIFQEPSKISSVSTPTTFSKRPNWFFESFLNPLLYVSIDLSNQVSYDMQQAFVKRIIANTDTDKKKSYFDSTYKGKSGIDHDAFVKDMNAQGIGYFLDEDIVDLPVSISRYSGNFLVTNIVDEVTKITATDGSVVSGKVRKYVLDKLTYTDNLQNYTDTQTLKIGDKISVNNTSEFEVTSVDSSTLSVTLKKLSGVDGIYKGQTVSISPSAFSLKTLQVNVGFDEREVIFIKPIDYTFNVTTREFSPGVGIFTNELTYTIGDKTYTLEEYYKNFVTDFGNSLLYLAKEKTVPAIYGIKPDSPRLNTENFKVVAVNTQKTDTDAINTIKKKTAQKNSVLSEIDQLDISIEKKKQELNTAQFNTDAERNAVKNQLDSLIRDKSSKSTLYTTLVRELASLAKNPPAELDVPKYRVRGFWPFPTAKKSTKTSDQNVIGFKYSYRYLRLDNTSTGIEQYDFVDNTGSTVRAYFSNWTEVTTPIRKKKFDTASGSYVWAEETVENADVVNVNQLDIPISKGEKVEIKIKSISEAGWPSNPLESDFSESIIIEFPSTLGNDEEVQKTLSAASAEETRVSFNQDLASRGLDTHLGTSFTQKDKYYAHNAESIASGFFTPEGNIVDLYSKLKEIQTSLSALQALVEKAKGKLQVSVIDKTGNKISIANNSLVNIFDGYYTDYVATLSASEKKGAIVTSYYSLVLENSAASTLQLVSSFPGGLDVGLKVSDPTLTTDEDYNKRRRYDIVGISLSSMKADSTSNDKKYHAPPFMSSQMLSQYLYVRSTDIGLVNSLVGYTGSTGSIVDNSYEPDFVGTSLVTSSFVWDGSYTGTAPDGGGYLTDFCIHTSHPSLNDGYANTYDALNRPAGATAGSSPAVYPKFRHAFSFDRDTSQANYKQQAIFIPTDTTGATGERYPMKLGFLTDDKYLIGSKTCGAYLYLAPSSYNDIFVNGTDYRAVREVEFGEENQLTIPLIFQYRMTDYYGEGDSGTGRIGGVGGAVSNLTYTKQIGIDIQVKEESVYSVDIQITAMYKINAPSQTLISPTKGTSLVSKQADATYKIL
jgi:hypothetical protein